MFSKDVPSRARHLRRYSNAGCYLLGLMVFIATLQGQAGEPGEVATKSFGVVASQELQGMFPASVYFRGRTAPIQWRNASAIRFSDKAIFFAGLIDNSGYASALQESYQMYLLTEQTVLVGDKMLPAGAYGAGLVDQKFTVMDIGGHTVLEEQAQSDEQLARPRPLQLLQPSASNVRLYLGKRWIRIALAPVR